MISQKRNSAVLADDVAVSRPTQIHHSFISATSKLLPVAPFSRGSAQVDAVPAPAAFDDHQTRQTFTFPAVTVTLVSGFSSAGGAW
ncbi:hypothetical protein ABH922_005369 [Rhodococcus sp. 27YEA15]